MNSTANQAFSRHMSGMWAAIPGELTVLAAAR